MQKDRLLTHNAKQRIWTSAGGSICLDLCIALLAEHAGQSLATAEANMLMMHYPRSVATRRSDGAPSVLPRPSRQSDEIIALTRRVREHLSYDWTLTTLAQTSHSSTRSFQRRFSEVMGVPPSTWLLTERLNATKELLELTDLPMQQIALRTGLRNADSLRKHFSAAFGVSPSRYRQDFLRTELRPTENV